MTVRISYRNLAEYEYYLWCVRGLLVMTARPVFKGCEA